MERRMKPLTLVTYDVVGEGLMGAVSFRRHTFSSRNTPKAGDVIHLYYPDGRSAYLAEVARVSELSMTVYVRALRN